MKNKQQTYTNATLFVMVLSVCFFIALKFVLPDRLFAEIQLSSDEITVDDLLLDAVNQFQRESEQTAQIIEDSLHNTSIRFEVFDGIVFPEERYANYSGKQFLLGFYEKLEALEQEETNKVRIAYFSDSMTDGDMIVQDLRYFLQSKFGGMGVGFVPMVSESAATRTSIAHVFSDNWEALSFVSKSPPSAPFGVSGQVFFAKDSVQETWTGFKSTFYANLKQLPEAKLYYGAAANLNARIVIRSEHDTIFKKITPLEDLNVLSLQRGMKNRLHFSFINALKIPFYGFSFETNTGIYVDNFSSRGNSGLPLSRLDIAQMNLFHKKRPYDLIVLHFGTNVLNYGANQYSWYEKGMQDVVNHIKKCFPNSSILIISTADKASKSNSEMITDAAVLPLLTAQRKYAIATQSGFFNLFEAMGGTNTMVNWVEGDPPLAAKDYTHFNYLGSKKVGALIYDELEAGFQQYKRLKRKHELLQTVNPENTINESSDAH